MQKDPIDTSLIPAQGLAGLFDGLSVPAGVIDSSLFFTAINPAFERRLGYSAADLIGRHVLSVYDPQTVDAVRAQMDTNFSNERTAVQVERHLLSRRGERFHSLVRISRYVESGQTFYSMLFEDLELTGVQEAMLVSRTDAFRVTIERSPIPITFQDKDWRFVLVNQAFSDYLGYEIGELLGRDPLDFLHSEELRVEVVRQREALNRLAHAEMPRLTSLRQAIRSDGQIVSYRLEFDRMQALDGSPLWCSMAIDLSHIAQAQAERDLQVDVARRMQTRFQSFSGSLDEAVIVVSPDGDKVLHANAATREVFEISPQSLIGGSIRLAWLHASEVSRHALGDAYRGMMRNGHAEAEAVFADGSGVDRVVRARFFRSEDPVPEYFVLGEDVTRRRQRQQARIDEALRQRETLVREIHHRIKNNLQGAAGLLERAAIRHPETREALRDVSQQIHAIAKVHGLQVRAGRLLDPAEVATSIAEQLASTYGRVIRIEAGNGDTGGTRSTSGSGRDGGARLGVGSVTSRSAAPWLLPESQGVAIALVINELLTNALKHGVPGTEVAMSALWSDDGIAISIANEGVLGDQIHGASGAGASGAGGGLQMLRQLLPMRGSIFELAQEGAMVVAHLHLSPPALQTNTTD